jgi:demethoxyubiquinone hydroxylase (CLK1/Coq7/Cat5 family)
MGSEVGFHLNNLNNLNSNAFPNKTRQYADQPSFMNIVWCAAGFSQTKQGSP